MMDNTDMTGGILQPAQRESTKKALLGCQATLTVTASSDWS